ncbi:MAG: hypothetical protein MUO82_04935 [Candidatus Thermoplasmatota archaeon]|nr:hypothetical protein [Candidatus Thermoplasmatota archaeon]
MKKGLDICLICMMLVLSNVFVFTTLPVVSAENLGTSVNSISPYWQNAIPEVNIRATVNSGTADNITLYYRYSSNNASWSSWTKWNGINNPFPNFPWAWTFNCPSGTGYYEFYSIGAKNSSYEPAPGSADARCHVTVSTWTRFGYYPVGYKSDDLTNVLQGCNFTCPSSGIADNMTVWLENGDLTANVSCAIYSIDRTTLIGYTEEKTIGIYQGWVTFNFIGEPFLVADTKYYLVVWGDGGHTRYNYNDSYHIIGKTGVTYTGIFPDNILGWSIWTSHVLSIYCRYTEYGPNSNPVNSNSYPINGAVNIPLAPARLSITVNDANGDLMNITFRTNESGTWKNADTTSIIGNGTFYCLNTSWIDSYSTKYWWSVNTSDGHGGWDNDTYSFTTAAANTPPNTPNNPNPFNHATSIDINADLRWTGGDLDTGDMVTYDIYLGTSSNPPLKKSGYTSTTYDPGAMNSYTKYYWKIISRDNHGASTSGPIWDFTTIRANNPPYTLGHPYPENGAINIITDIDFIWSGGDPDVGDTVTYDVYFGSMQPLQKVASNISTQIYNPGILSDGLTYFWNVIAWDNHGLSTNGPLWHFTTTSTSNNPPNKPSKPTGQIYGTTKQLYLYTTNTTDPDGDQVYYLWEWGDNSFEWVGPYDSSLVINASHAWAKGTYQIRVKAKDFHGLESEWSDPLLVSMPKTKIYNPIIQLLYKILEHFPILEKILNQYYN